MVSKGEPLAGVQGAKPPGGFQGEALISIALRKDQSHE